MKGGSGDMAWGKLLVAFVCLFAGWVTFTGSLDIQELAVGIIVAALVALLSHELLFKRPMREKFGPKRLGYALAYVPAYVWAEIKAHADVIYRILHPKMPIKPGIVEVPTDLKTDFGITGLADSITMTPGTLSVEVDEKKPSLYVHWINVKAVEPAQTKAAIAGPFERFLTKVFG
jgi:multicomponent Na+:H+ antiporter subunit E